MAKVILCNIFVLFLMYIAVHAQRGTPREINPICREPQNNGSRNCGVRKEWRYFFDYREYQRRGLLACGGFDYNGCGGNRNNFKTIEDCFRVCQRRAEDDSDADAGADAGGDASADAGGDTGAEASADAVV